MGRGPTGAPIQAILLLAYSGPGFRLASPARSETHIVSGLDLGSLASALAPATLDSAVEHAAGHIDAAIFGVICEAIQDVGLGQVHLGPAQIGGLRVTAGPPLDAKAQGVLTGCWSLPSLGQ